MQVYTPDTRWRNRAEFPVGRDDSGQWFRSYGNENWELGVGSWEFNEQGFMLRRFASINDLPIEATARKFFWPLGQRPDDYPGLSDLGL